MNDTEPKQTENTAMLTVDALNGDRVALGHVVTFHLILPDGTKKEFSLRVGDTVTLELR